MSEPIKPGDTGTKPFEDGWVARSTLAREYANFLLLLHVPTLAFTKEEYRGTSGGKRPVTVAMKVARMLMDPKQPDGTILHNLSVLPAGTYVVLQIAADEADGLYFNGKDHQIIHKRSETRPAHSQLKSLPETGTYRSH